MKIDPRISPDTKVVDVYKIDDQEFATLAEANDYLAASDELLNWSYASVGHHPNLDGGGYQRWTIVATTHSRNSVIAYALGNLGSRPVVKSHGDQPADAWHVNDPKTYQTLGEIERFMRGMKNANLVFIDGFGGIVDTPAGAERLRRG